MAAPIVRIFDAGDYERQISTVADALRAGALAVLPTETVYGAAAILNQPKAIDRLRALPAAMLTGPLVVHIANADQAARFLGPVSDLGRRMMRKLWPGPVGMMFRVPEPRQKQAATELGIRVEDIYDGQNITLRCPDHVVSTDVIEQAGGAVAIRKVAGLEQAVPAAEELPAEWRDKLDVIVDAGPTRYSKPSTLIQVKDDSYDIVRAGIYDQRIIEKLLRTTILFVCSGNTCRSPMAEAIARQLLAKKLSVSEGDLEKRGVTVLSAGSFAMPGARATQAAVEALRPAGVDLSRHRSRPLTVELIHQADVIYAMSHNHAGAVRALVPSAADKVVTLDPEGDIEDPIGGDLSTYQSLAEQLHTLIERRLEEQSLP